MKYVKKYLYVYTLFLSKCPNNGDTLKAKLKMVKVVFESWFELKNVQYATKNIWYTVKNVRYTIKNVWYTRNNHNLDPNLKP